MNHGEGHRAGTQALLGKELEMLQDEQAGPKEIFERGVVRTNCCVV